MSTISLTAVRFTEAIGLIESFFNVTHRNLCGMNDTANKI